MNQQIHPKFTVTPRTPPILGISEQSAVVSHWIRRNMQETAMWWFWWADRSMKAVNRLGFVFRGGNYVQQMHRLQH